MDVVVKYYAMLRERVGKKNEALSMPEKTSVRKLLDVLVERNGEEFAKYVYDKDKRLKSQLSFMLNGVNIKSLDGGDTILNQGDVLSLMPPVGGG